MKTQRYPLFDALRILLAIEVVADHAFNFHSWPLPPVPTFVCLSGFLIPGSFTSSRNWGHFAWKRLLRVMPAFILSMGLVAGLMGPSAIKPTLLYYVTAGLLTAMTANGALWSLCVEEVLYVAHGFSRTIIKIWNRWTVLGTLLASIALHAWMLTVPPFPAGIGHTNLRGHVWVLCAFLAGNLAYFYKKDIARIAWPYILGAYALVYGAFFFAPFMINFLSFGHSGFDIGLLAGIQAIVLTAIPLTLVFVAYRLPQPKVELPDLSYGVYVFHSPILETVALWHLSNVMNFGISLGVVLPLAAISWFLIEKPVLALKNWRPSFRGQDVPVADAV